MRTLFRLLLDPAPTEGNGSGSGSTPPPAAAATTPPADDAAFKAAIAKTDAVELARGLFAQVGSLTAERDQLRARLPADGAVVLAGADATAWAAFREIAPDPAELKARLEAGTAAQAEVSRYRRTEEIRAVAATADFDADVLAPLVGDLKFKVTPADPANPKSKPAGFVLTTDAEGKEKPVPLADYAKATWPKFLNSLKAQPQHVGTPNMRAQAPAATTGQGQGQGQGQNAPAAAPTRRLATF